MLEKILACFGNVLLASVLVVLSSQQFAFAADEQPVNGGDEEGRILVPLTGNAVTTDIAGLQVVPASFDTGVVPVGESKVQGVTIQHAGSADALPIEISTATLFGTNVTEYHTDFVGFVTLNPGESIDFDVIFTPTIPGTKSAGLRMEVEGATAPHIILFNGWSRYAQTSDLGVAGEEIDFGEIIEGATSTKNIVLTNLGDAEAPAISVYNIELSGDTPQAFNVNFNQIQIQPGESVNVQVVMSGADLGFKSADVVINHDGNNASVKTTFDGSVVPAQNVPINFGKSSLNNATVTRATTLQFGPDGKLYVGEMGGAIKVFAVIRNGANNYTATQTDNIQLIKNVPNHDDDGTLNAAQTDRLLTGIFVTGTAAAPIIYAASSDPRQAAGPSGTDSNLDTNSGILHRLTKNGGGWVKEDLVRGLPRSEENHVPNGLTMYNNKILLVTGGHTNMGAPSHNFARLPEFALSAAVLEIDVDSINGTYDIPTLDDDSRAGVNDSNDPFGGNNGKNQAMLVQNGVVGLFATGFRNAYDITITESGKIYTFDNGPNPGWGGTPMIDCSNTLTEDGSAHHSDNLHLLTKNYYGGHPNPTRANKSNTFNTDNVSPIETAARPEECNYLVPGDADGDDSLTTIKSSSNGMDEYTASNFLGSMKGDLLVATFKNTIDRVELNAAGTAVTSKSELAEDLGTYPLDLTVHGDNDAFPGTIWVADNGMNTITILEPSDY